jgi:hypothetical protein
MERQQKDVLVMETRVCALGVMLKHDSSSFLHDARGCG